MIIPTIRQILIFISFHHICFLTRFAPRLKPCAEVAKLSVLSWSESRRSPRWETLLMFSRMTPTVSSICCRKNRVSGPQIIQIWIYCKTQSILRSDSCDSQASSSQIFDGRCSNIIQCHWKDLPVETCAAIFLLQIEYRGIQNSISLVALWYRKGWPTAWSAAVLWLPPFWPVCPAGAEWPDGM